MLITFQRNEHQGLAYKAVLKLLGSAVAVASIVAPLQPAVAAQRTPSIRIVTPQPISPMLLLVSLRKQRIRAFDVTGELNSSRISSGRSGFDTPTGVFSVLEKKEYHESNIYDSAPMPFMQRLTWSGIALHAGVVPGYRASHGCIRLPASFAKSLFGVTKIGTRIIVTQDETDPIPFDHRNLFKPLPADAPNPAELQTAGGPTKVASNDTGKVALSEIPQFLGVTTAMAAAASEAAVHLPPGKPRTRQDAERMYKERSESLKRALETASAAKIAATEQARRTLRESQALQPQLIEARKILDPLRATIATSDAKLDDAIVAFQRFMSGAPTSTKPPAAGKSSAKVIPVLNVEEREADLEDNILDLRLESDAARTELARRELEFAVLLGTEKTVEAEHEKALTEVREAQSKLRVAQAELIESNKQAVRNSRPLSIFISLKTERIYLRQGFDPLIEAPITVKADGRRLGTHVFTAMRYAERNPDALDWSLVSAHLPVGSIDQNDQDTSKKKKKTKTAETVMAHTDDNSFEMASDALDSITVPADILEKISELARPGMSVIISDRDLPANENGLGTEFVVLTR